MSCKDTSNFNGIGTLDNYPLRDQALKGETKAIARLIDHTLLKPDASAEQVKKLCQEAEQYCFMSVCVNPWYVALAAQELKNSDVKVCTVIGFPLGAATPTLKAAETTDAIANGADEIDMVINIGAVKSGDWQSVKKDMQAVAEAAKGKALSKVIFETCLLTDEEIIKSCEIAVEAGIDYVKTSTGFSTGGATEHHIKLMRDTVKDKAGVKASGAVRDSETAIKMLKAGATRIGASASIAIAQGGTDASGY